MNVVCYGGWRAASLLWQPGAGAWMLTVACHVSYELAPGESPVLAKPPALDGVGDDDDRAFVEPWGPVAPRKRHPEVLVVGHAHASPGTKVTSLVARLGVGDFEKLVHVHGDAYLGPSGPTQPVPFERMPLRWERAAGAPHGANPVGVAMGEAAVADAQGRVSLPNLRPMGTSIERRDDVLAPVGFGPIPSTWPSRVERLHQHAARWDARSWAERPLPGDFDHAYFDVAPPDQALERLTGDELLVLEHLHPRLPRLETRLVRVAPCVVVSVAGVERDVAVVRDTLVIDSDRGVAVQVWRGHVPLVDARQEVVVFVSPGRIGAGSTGTQVVGAAPDETMLVLPSADAGVDTLSSVALPPRPALPFVRAPEDPPASGSPARAEPSSSAISDEDTDDSDPPTLRRPPTAR